MAVERAPGVMLLHFLLRLWDLCVIARILVLMATFIHWGTRAASELYQFCKYIANENERLKKTG